MVKALIAEFVPPERMTYRAFTAMGELSASMNRDFEEGRLFAFLSRMRQVEELYIRTLYTLFVATEPELPHISSGDWPNGLSGYYAKVNELVFEGRGQLLDPVYRPIDTFHGGAHASFGTMFTCIAIVYFQQQGQRDDRALAADYCGHAQRYCSYLKYMFDMFSAGKDRKDVLCGVIALHKPESFWTRGSGA